MAKVLYINPVVREDDVPRHVPYGIALLAAISIDDGHLVQVYDDNAWRKGDDVLREVLAADDWDVIALGGITTAYGSIKRTVGIAREVCPDTLIVLVFIHGPHRPLHPPVPHNVITVGGYFRF